MTKPIKALLIDLSGVLYVGKHLLPGAQAVIEEARKRGLVLRFVTNTATKSQASILRDLEHFGIQASSNELFSAPIAAKSYIRSHSLRPFCLIHPALKPDFDDLDQSDPNCVLLGDARKDLSYDNLNRVFQLLIEDLPLIALGMNRYFKAEGGLMLDAGPFVKALEWATEQSALVMGKPSKDFYLQVVDSTGIPIDQCMMIGDDVESDVIGAINAGLQGCLVQTGKYLPGDEKKLPNGAKVIQGVNRFFKPTSDLEDHDAY